MVFRLLQRRAVDKRRKIALYCLHEINESRTLDHPDGAAARAGQKIMGGINGLLTSTGNTLRSFVAELNDAESELSVFTRFFLAGGAAGWVFLFAHV